jgi:hypothetical protein
MSQTALVLTEEAAEEAGLTGGGPFTFAGVFPGVWHVGQPVAVSELGFDDDDEAVDRAEELGLPLSTTTVAEGEGKADRGDNHAPSERQVAAERKAAAIADETGSAAPRSIRSHAEADAIAADLGISFDEGAKLSDKVVAIEAFNAAAAVDDGVQPSGDDESLADAQHEAATAGEPLAGEGGEE